jgi:hypothetical protein
MTKTNAGTAPLSILVRVGTNGTTADANPMTFVFGAGTAVADTGEFEVDVNWRAVGVSAIISGYCRASHNLATTGLFNNAAVWTVVAATSGTFDASSATKIGISIVGGTSFSGTNKVVQASLQQ